MSIWKKPLKLGILLTIFSINCYAASSLEVVKPEIKKIAFWSGKWHINYAELKNGTNLLEEELFVDGNSDRVVNIGTEENRGFSMFGTYAKAECHKAYVVVYDKAHSIVTKSDVFEFGDTSKCNLPLAIVKPEINRVSFFGGKWHINYTELKNGTNLLKEELFVDGSSDRVVNIGMEERRGFSLQGTYSEDSCHKAYVVVYDKAHSIVTKSDVFEFGDTSKCNLYNESPDTVNPVITLNGKNPQILIKGQAYKELGATAFDNRDGDLSKSIVIDISDVDTSIIGNSTVAYDVVDSAGNDVSIMRIVKVVEEDFIGELEIHKINFYRGKWNIRYQDLRKVKGLKKEILFVDGDEVRTVTGGYNRPYDRGFSFAGDYAEDACHEAYVVAYDADDNELSKSNTFEFGDTSICTDTTIVPTAPKNVRTNSRHENYDSRLNIVFEDTASNELGFHIYNDKKLIKSIEAHEGQGEVVVSLEEFGAGEIVNIVIKAFNDVGESEDSNRLLYISNFYDGWYYNGIASYSLYSTGKSGLYKVSVYQGAGSTTTHHVSFLYIKDGKITYTSLGYQDHNIHGGRRETRVTELSEDIISYDAYDHSSDWTDWGGDILYHDSSQSTYSISDLSNIFMISGNSRSCTAPRSGYGSWEFTLSTYKIWSNKCNTWITIYDKSIKDKGYDCYRSF